jgi:molybdopterin molybdotransferase
MAGVDLPLSHPHDFDATYRLTRILNFWQDDACMTSLEQSRQCVAEAIEPLDPVRTPLAAALGCVLREDARAREDMPAFDRSAMDGYAIDAEDASERFRVVGESRPGVRPGFAVRQGECARIFTGAEIPEGASLVLKQEDVRAHEGWITPETRPAADYVRRRGEEARTGDRLLGAGLRLGPAEIGVLASLGIVEPLVSPRCRAAHFATGDELVDPGDEPGPSRIRDSNSALVRAFVETQGAVMMRQERVPDDADLLTARLRLAADEGCDLLLISGGASVGAYDFGRTSLERLKFQIRFEKVNLRPGKPLTFATRGRQAAFVLPGNPLSHLAVLNCVVCVAFERLAGAQPAWRVLNARLLDGIRIGGDGRDTLWPARVDMGEGEPVVRALGWRSSGDITGLAGLNAFIRCAVPVLDTGARVPCILLHG